MSEHADLLTGLHAEPGMHDREWQVVNTTGHRICYVQAFSEDEAIYLARSIARAVNSHEDALEACRLIIRAYENADAAPEALDRAYAAIAKATKAERSES